jgi:hypothetical protein
MFRLYRSACLLTISLYLAFGFCLEYFLINPALATSPIGQKISDKATDPPVQQPVFAASPPMVKGDYGRLPEHFIINRGQPDERIQIFMNGEGQKTLASKDKLLQDKVPQKQNLLLRPFMKGNENVKSKKSENGEATEANPEESNVVKGFVATVTGPGEVSFLWKVSCEPAVAYLEATLDGKQISKISGEIDWSLRKLTVPEGTHTLCWLYCKNGEAKYGADCGWLDQVEFIRTKVPDTLVSTSSSERP